MSKRFQLMDKGEAEKAGLEAYGGGDYPLFVVEILPDGQKRLVGSDGGEPEDQRLSRDWSWVVPALNAAFEAGRASALAEREKGSS